MRRIQLFASSLVLGLTACGGGGGGGGGGASGANTPPPQTPLVFSGVSTQATITSTNAGVISANVVSASGASASSGVVSAVAVRGESGTAESLPTGVTGLARRLTLALHSGDVARTSGALSGVATNVPMACDSGSMTISGTPAANGTGTFSITYNACRTGSDTLNGPAQLRIDGWNNGVITDGTVTITRVSFTGPGINMDLTGTMRTQVDIPSNTTTLTENIITQDNNSGRMMRTDNLVIVNRYDSVFSPTFYRQSITGRVYDSVAGFVDVTTTTAPFSDPWGPLYYATSQQSFPDWGQINLTGANGSRVRVSAIAVDIAKVEVDADGNGVFENTARMRWADFNSPVGADLADQDHDGLHNSYETAMGLNPFDASDANADPDGDGASNRTEYLAGSDPRTNGSVPDAVRSLWLTDASNIGFDPTSGLLVVSVPSGLASIDPVTRDIGTAAGPAPAQADDNGGLTYTTAGQQIDPATNTVLGTFPGVDPASADRNLVLPVASLGRVFYLTPSTTPGAAPNTWTLRAFDTNTRTLLASLEVQNVSGDPAHLIRYGARGIAFHTVIGYIFLVETSALIP